MDDNIIDENKRKYSELSEEEKADFKTILIPCQEITIERKDPDNTIAEMFIRLNTQANPLKHGELFKAYGHRGDIWEIEMAKKIIGDCWSSKFKDDVKINEIINISSIFDSWNDTFGYLGETNRCDSLAMMLGFIISAKESNFNLFDKRYDKLQNKLSESNKQPTQENYAIYIKIWNLLDIVSQIDKGLFGKITKGLPPQTNISPIWKIISENRLDISTKRKIIEFYKSLIQNEQLRNEFKNLFKGSNSETTSIKTEKIITFILSN